MTREEKLNRKAIEYSLAIKDFMVMHGAKEESAKTIAKMVQLAYIAGAAEADANPINLCKPAEDVDLPEFESYLCLMFQKFRAKGMCTNGEIIDYVKEHSQKLRDILVNPAWSEEDEKQGNLITELQKTYAEIGRLVKENYYLKEKQAEQKPVEWNRVDNVIVEGICLALEYSNESGEKIEKYENWLKSLKNRVQPQPKQEWSDEDEEIRAALIKYLGSSDALSVDLASAICWLKSLRPQKQWKPSNEQIEALEHSLGDYNIKIFEDRYEILKSLYNELKKLKE